MSQSCVIDSNVVVTGLITAQTDAPVSVILEGMLSAAFPFVLSPALLAESREVLLRPQLQKLHGLIKEQVDVVLTDLARHAIVFSTPADSGALRAPDPGDQFLRNLLGLRPDLLLVTGDTLLLHGEAMLPRVISPLAPVTRLQNRGGQTGSDNFCRTGVWGQKLSVTRGDRGHKSSLARG